MKRISDEAIRMLGDWWFDRFLSPNHDNGDRSLGGMFACGMADMAADKHPITEEQREPFISALTAECQKALDDYVPSGTLAAAMDAAGIVDVLVRNNGIWISTSYGASQELLCDLEGVAPTKRWVFKTTTPEGRSITEYDYSEYAHHGRIAAYEDYGGGGYEGYEVGVEVPEDGTWRSTPVEVCQACGRAM